MVSQRHDVHGPFVLSCLMGAYLELSYWLSVNKNKNKTHLFFELKYLLKCKQARLPDIRESGV